MKRNLFIVFVLACAVGWLTAAPQAAQQPAFAQPDQAAQALVDAASRNDTAALLKLFGPSGKEFVESGDPAEDRGMRESFVSRSRARMRIEPETDNPDRAIIVVGENDWPFPVPLVRKNGQWRFDAAQGKMEILARTVGHNEMTAIDVCRGYVEAQMQYAERDRNADGSLEYAQQIISSPGKQDGLYWEGAAPDLVPKSFADAAAAILLAQGKKPTAYHGYFFHILKAQGPDAVGGAMNYVVKGEMIGGFAMVAWPAEYGVSGIKTFLVSHRGAVWEKDLGPMTATLARAMTRFNPDKTWRSVEGE